MIDNATAIARLELSKRALQAQCNSASGARLLQLMSAIHLIADEVGQLEVSTLQDAPYIPQTDAFKQQTADAKAFVASLESLKVAFADLASVADSLVQLVGIVA